jgi:prepilin-type N-terminal cleavage/methylation domain-containing protein
MKKENGFTLIELVLVIVLLGILASGGATLLAEGFNSFFKGRDITEADWQARVALERMGRDLRAIRSPSDIASSSSATSITFTNVDGNTLTYSTPSGGNQILFSDGTNTAVLADGANLNLTYYDGTGNVLTAPPATTVRYIAMALTITYHGANFIITQGVYPWNF